MDIQISLALQNIRGALGETVFGVITFLGSEIPLMALMCLIYWCLDKRVGTRLMLTFFASLVTNQFLKLLFRTPRPWLRDARITPAAGAIEDATGYSFPSGHTANAVAGYGALARGLRAGIVKWALWLVVVLIAFSRVYLGVHTIQDVLVSLVLGVLIVFAIQYVCARLDTRPRADIWVAIAGVALALGLLAFALIRGGEDVKLSLDAFKFSGGALGVMLGWLLERRKLNFSVEGRALKKAIRLALGMALVIAILNLLKSPLNVFLGERAGGCARYALVGSCALYAWPWAFSKLKL